ncbi:MAG: OmpA family protein [bacterium]
MKKVLIVFSFALLLTFSDSQAQVAKDAWGFGFGFSYPRFFSSDVRPLEACYGGYLSIQRNFNENVALRLLGSYNHIQGRIPGYGSGGFHFTYENGAPIEYDNAEMSTDVMMGQLDFMYYFVPCLGASPYMFIGGGLAYYAEPNWGDVVNTGLTDKLTTTINFGFGIEWKVGDDWKFLTEGGMHNIDSQVDGILNNNRQGIFGAHSDLWLTANLGLVYYFDKGAPSRYCDLYDGINVDLSALDDLATREDVENIVKKYIPKEVIKEVVVEKPCEKKAFVLIGVNFDFNKATLRPESYPILLHAVQVLAENPDLNVEVAGHTDYIGSDKYNQGLSERRAQTVKDYLVGKGIASSRLTVKGYGESMPINSSKTDEARAMNRRVEFKY